MDTLQFYYQSKTNVQTNTVIGYEILLRNKEVNPYYPSFDMDTITADQEKHALFLEWFEIELKSQFQKFPNTMFSINLSPRQLLHPETHLFLTHMLHYRKNLIIEITEELITFFSTTNYHTIKEVEDKLCHSLSLIKEKGYKISLDDVGSGCNSLERVESYLSYIDQIKHSLVKNRCSDVKDETTQLFLKAWSSFAKKHHIELVVEGIEDKETMSFLSEQGIFLQQGYYLGKPCKYINY